MTHINESRFIQAVDYSGVRTSVTSRFLRFVTFVSLMFLLALIDAWRLIEPRLFRGAGGVSSGSSSISSAGE